MRKVLFLLLAAGIISCGEHKRGTLHYYPIDSLLQAQTKYLSASNAVLTKHARVDGNEETISYKPKNDTVWSHELDVFAELNSLNKPTNVGSYGVELGLKDVNSNLLINSFESTKNELPVVYLKVYYLEKLSELRIIEALYREKSSLLRTSRLLTMEFQNIHNKIVLTSYSIDGGQKMLLGDSVTFSVKGLVTLP